MLSITILVLTGSHPLNAIDFVFCTDIVKPYSVIVHSSIGRLPWALSLNLDV